MHHKQLIKILKKLHILKEFTHRLKKKLLIQKLNKNIVSKRHTFNFFIFYPLQNWNLMLISK